MEPELGDPLLGFRGLGGVDGAVVRAAAGMKRGKEQERVAGDRRHAERRRRAEVAETRGAALCFVAVAAEVDEERRDALAAIAGAEERRWHGVFVPPEPLAGQVPRELELLEVRERNAAEQRARAPQQGRAGPRRPPPA